MATVARFLELFLEIHSYRFAFLYITVYYNKCNTTYIPNRFAFLYITVYYNMNSMCRKSVIRHFQWGQEVGRRPPFILSSRGFPTYKTGAFSTQQSEDLCRSFWRVFTIKCVYTGTPGVPPLSNRVKCGQKQNNCFISVFRGGQLYTSCPLPHC